MFLWHIHKQALQLLQTLWGLELFAGSFSGTESIQIIAFLIVLVLVHMEVTGFGFFPMQRRVKKMNQSDFHQKQTNQIILGFAS